MTALFDYIIEASWQASMVVGLILLIQSILHRRLSPGWRCAMWTLVLARLVMPALPESRFSLLGLVSPPQASPSDQATGPTVTYGVFPEAPSAQPSAIVPPPRAPSPGIDWRRILAAVWLAGALLALSRLCVTNFRFACSLRAIPETTDSLLLNLTNVACRELNVRRRPRVLETGLVNVPALSGVIWPTILIPSDARHRLSRDQLRFVLLHELAHLKRRDLLIGWVVAVLNAIHWFNPILWFAAARFRADRELACDARVLWLTDQAGRCEYGRTILRVIEGVSRPTRLSAAVAMVEGPSSLRRRIAAIAQPVLGGWRWSILLAVILIAVAWMTLTRPNDPKPQAIDTSDPNTRIYDVRDLIANIPDFGDDSKPHTDEHGWPIIEPAPAEPSRETLIAHLVTLIQDTIDSDSWTDRGGTSGSIREVNGQLIVNQTPANHDSVGRLLAQLRETRGVQIVVECRFVAGESVLADLKAVLNDPAATEPLKPAFLTDQQAQALIKSIQGSTTSATLTAPRLTLFNGQRAFVTVQTETAYVGDFTAKNGAFEPVIKKVRSGVNFDCRATVSADHRYVTLTLRPHLARLQKLEPRRWPGAPDGRNDLIIQVPTLDKVTANTTVSVPDGGWIALPPGADSTFGPNQNPLILVRPTIINEGAIPATTPSL